MLIGSAVAMACPATVQESRKVDQVPDGFAFVDGSLRFSADGSKVAYVARKGEELFPVIGHAVGKGFRMVDAPVIDASGEHVAFRTILLKRSGDMVSSVLLDGKEFATAEWIGPVALSPADGTPAFWTALGHATEADGSLDFSPVVLVFGKKKSAKWQSADNVLAPQFSADGLRVFSVGTKDEDWGIMSLDRKGAEEKQMGGHIVEVWLNPNGRELACTVLDLSKGDPDEDEPHKFFIQRRAVPDLERTLDALGKAYDAAGGLVYDAEGAHFAFRALAGDKLGVSFDGEEADCTFDFVDELTIAPGGSQVAFVAARDCELDAGNGWEVLEDMADATGGRWSVVQGKTASQEYERTRLPTWSPDGTRLAFAARANKTWRVVVGSSSGEPCDEIGRIVWAADGSCVWYGARLGGDLWWKRMPVE
jgi:WD40 repeat protein